MTDKYILQARELLAVELEKQYCPTTAGSYRKGDYDGNPDMRALVRVLREQPPQPTFEQRVEAMKRTYQTDHDTYEDAVEAYDLHLAEIMAPKVDPLVEAFDEIHGHEVKEGETWSQAIADRLRKALADRGFKIVPEEKA